MIHQLDLLNEFAKSNYIIPWNENEEFDECWQRLEIFYQSICINQR